MTERIFLLVDLSASCAAMATYMTKANDLFGARVTLGYVCDWPSIWCVSRKLSFAPGRSMKGFGQPRRSSTVHDSASLFRKVMSNARDSWSLVKGPNPFLDSLVGDRHALVLPQMFYPRLDQKFLPIFPSGTRIAE